MHKVLSVFVALVAAVLLIGCGGGGSSDVKNSAFVGQWTVDKQAMKVLAEATLKEQLKGLKEELVTQQIEATKRAIDQTQTSLRINNGGTFSLVSSSGMQASTSNGTWAKAGRSIMLNSQGQPEVKAEIKNGKLHIENKTGEGPTHTVLVRVTE